MKNSMSPITTATAHANAVCTDQLDCPNCWGTQEWNNEYQAAEVRLDTRPQAANKRDGFIRKFVQKYVSGY